MPRSYSALLIAVLAGGGWFFTKGPGQGKFGDYVSTAKQAIGQAGASGGAPSTYPTLPSLPQAQGAVGAVATNYDVQSAPAVAPPSPMFGGPAIRIASFNIQVFGDEKAKYPGLMATLGAIIRSFHIVAIQEIRTQDDYFLDNFLRNYVNQDGRAYDKIIGPRLGRSKSTEQYAFIYDTSVIQVNRNSIFTINDPDDLLHREPLVAMFRVRGPPPEQAFTFVLINIHTDPDETDTELDALAKVYQAVRRAAGGEDDIILLGDLNVDDQNLGELGRLDGVRPIVRGAYTNTRQNAQYDNIIIHQPSTSEFSGRWGVFDTMRIQQLTPQQALHVSDHLPVWAEFSAYESTAPGRVAARNGVTIHAQ